MKHMRRYIARTVLVTSTGGTFKGTLDAADADGVTLGHVTGYGANAGPLDGQVVIPTAAIQWAQVV
ncbi:hypothetical protein [Nocardioides nanhaiensis]|uniref:Uncharacterized protein n=1 Tax=Nocardioides nanhaiensis TaxID=1476871 RepID=A0ABP8W636_9ACTN